MDEQLCSAFTLSCNLFGFSEIRSKQNNKYYTIEKKQCGICKHSKL